MHSSKNRGDVRHKRVRLIGIITRTFGVCSTACTLLLALERYTAAVCVNETKLCRFAIHENGSSFASLTKRE